MHHLQRVSDADQVQALVPYFALFWGLTAL